MEMMPSWRARVVAWSLEWTAITRPGKDPIAPSNSPQANPPYITDSGNYLIDCTFPLIQDPSALAQSIKAITGVVEHGLFTGIPTRLIVASPDGIRNYDPFGNFEF